jgi:ribonuclease HI
MEEKFHFGPILGTNNIGEFLAIVHALALYKSRGLDWPLYSDSRNAIDWVQKKQCRTKLERTPETEAVFERIESAERWLRENSFRNRIIKWDTKKWGEIPADFGRK